MAIIKDIGVVLREYDTGESNKRLVLLTENHGKITVFSKGAKRQGSKLTTNLFCCNEFIIFDGGSFLSLNQTTCVHNFARIAEDFDGFCYASGFLEIIEKMLLPGMEASVVLRLLLRAFAELASGRSPDVVFAAYIFKFLQIEGFAPIVEQCTACGASINGGYYFFKEGVLCGRCDVSYEKICISDAVCKAMKYILNTDGKRVFAFETSKDVQKQLCSAATLFLYENVDVELKSISMLIGGNK